ncbi:MAG: DOPA 4,5-dioxygenase family protein [Pseudomonadota bacterium]
MEISDYHFHIYFEETGLKRVELILEKLKDFEELKIGRVHVRPVGPHPTGSCQVSVPSHLFEKALQWFLKERDGLSLFIHPLTGDDYLDHTDHAIWLGKPYKLKTDIFKPKR